MNSNKKLPEEYTVYFVSDFEIFLKKNHANNFLESVIANGYISISPKQIA